MTKEELSQVFYLTKEIKMWQAELNRLECQSLIKGQEITGMPFSNTNVTSDKTGELATKKQDIRIIIEGKVKERELQRDKIIMYINNIDDSFMRQVIYYRHVSCLSWGKVAEEIGGGNTTDSVRKAHDRFMEKIK